ncbi:unnamed protein product [Haemonchus placei]|uniref:snRNA-activating protein complex subunit 1 n=1 Tax=Haemonchus placei TaxID=6290 RepID=A0A0N4VUC4_HAEPC|nr:unnamed protein product [Haemonchus placei]
MRGGISVPLVNSGILSDVDMMLEAFKEKRSVRLVKFHEVAVDFELCNVYAGRLNVPDLLEFAECFLRAAFDCARPRKETKIGELVERTLTERIFGIYATYVLYYAQPTDYVSKILVTSQDLVDLKQFVTESLLPGRHLDTIGCIYKLLADDAFSVGAFPKCYDPACHRGYTLPFSPDDVVDEDEKHAPLEAAASIMEHPILKTMAHVQQEMELKQSLISDRPIVAELKDNFLNRLTNIYASLKREVDKSAVTNENGVVISGATEELAQGPSRSSIKDKAYGSSIQYARNRRYADPNMHENFPDAGNCDEEKDEDLTVSDSQPAADVASPPKRKRKPRIKLIGAKPPDAADGTPGESSKEVAPSPQRRQKMRAPKRAKGVPLSSEAKPLSDEVQPEITTPVEEQVTSKVVRVEPASSNKQPARPPVDPEFEAEMKRIEALLDDSQSQRAKELLG